MLPGAITLYKAKLRKLDFLKIPPAERNLFIVLGVMISEFHTLNKILIFILNQNVDNDEIKRKARSVQFFQIAPILIGKINEGWNVVTKCYFGSQLSKSIHPHLDRAAQQSVDELKKYFGKSNLVNRIRNMYSFHYPVDTDDTLRKIGGREDWNLYISDLNINCLFHGCNIVTMFGMLESIDPASIEKASHELIDDLKAMLGHFDEFTSSYMNYVAKKYLGHSIKRLNIRRLQIENLQSLRKVELPYFVTN